MGYPEEHRDVTEKVEYESPSDVVFANGFSEPVDISTINVGAGSGPHHLGSLSLVNALGRKGAGINVVRVQPTGESGTPEELEETLDSLSGTESVEVHNVTSDSVAEGLVSTAADNGNVLVIGASRTRFLRRWIFGGTPDRVIERADEAGVPVIIYTSPTGVPGRLEDALFPVYRYLQGFTSSGTPPNTP